MHRPHTVSDRVDNRRVIPRKEGIFTYSSYSQKMEIPEDLPVHRVTPEEDEAARQLLLHKYHRRVGSQQKEYMRKHGNKNRR